MQPIALLWPSFAMVALIFVVWITLFAQRINLIRRQPPGPEDFATTAAAARYFEPAEMAANNLRNLFEMPVLYFALVPLLMLTHHGDHVQVVLAWVYVALRAMHSFIHIGPKVVNARFAVYMASCAVLSAMWVGFAVDMIAAASTMPALP